MEELNSKLNAYKIPIGFFVVGVVLLIGGLFSSNLIGKPEPKIEFPKESIVSQSSLDEIKIDVSGAVNSPGVFTISENSRIEDAISLAGGFTDKANKEFISKKLNLSQKVTDGLKIYIPFEGEEAGEIRAVGGIGEIAGVSAQGKVGINSADQVSLEALPGIGPVTAKKIIENRPYAKVEELLSKKSVSKAVFTKIKELVDLN